MRRTNLDKGLQESHKQVVDLSSKIEQSLVKTLTSLGEGNLTLLSSVIEAASSINTYCADVERHSLRLLLLQQPLAGRDMRFLTATLHISSDLSWINNTLIEIAEIILKIASLSKKDMEENMISNNQYVIPTDAVDQYGNVTDAFIIRGLLDLGKETTYRFQQTMEAFASYDIVVAKRTEIGHNSMNSRYMTLYNDILNMQAKVSALSTLQYDVSIVQRATYFLWIAQKLQQIAIYLINTCKRIIFIIEG